MQCTLNNVRVKGHDVSNLISKAQKKSYVYVCICAHTWEVGRDETEERWGVETEEDGLIRQIEQNVKKFVGCWYKVWGVPCTILAAFLYAWNYIKIQQYTKNYKKLSKMDLEVKSDFSIASWLFSSSFSPLLCFFSFYSWFLQV